MKTFLITEAAEGVVSFSYFRNSEQNKCLWKLSDISEKSENEGKSSFYSLFAISSKSFLYVYCEEEIWISCWQVSIFVCLTPGAGSLRAKFELSNGPSNPSTLAVQFMSDGSTLSGVDMELQGAGYRLSLNKKRFATGM